MEKIAVEIVLILLVILANGFFAGAEIALVSARVSRLAELRQQAVRGVAAALRLKEAPETFLATIQIAITLGGTLASAVGGAAAVEALTPWLVHIGAGGWAQPVALAMVIVAITYTSLILGELAPKAVALRDPERQAGRVAPSIEWLSRRARVVVRLLTASTNAVLAVIGQRRGQPPPPVSREELGHLVREGAASGVFEPGEEELILRVLERSGATVRQLMTPREAVRGVDIDASAPRLLDEMAAHGHTRVPVFRGALDRVVGVISLGDVVAAVAAGRPLSAPALMREPMLVSGTASISALLRDFQRSRQRLGVVVGERGELEGVVTVSDVADAFAGDPRERRGPAAERSR